MKSLSIKTLAIVILCILGAASILISLFGAAQLKQSALESLSLTLPRITRLSSAGVMTELRETMQIAGTSGQKDRNFRKAVKKRLKGDEDAALQQAIVAHLDVQFHRMYHTTGLMSLQKARLFDLNFKFVAASTEGVNNLPQTLPAALELQARGRKGAERMKTLNALWLTIDDTPLVSMLIPVGGLRLTAYLELVVDPVHNLRQVEQLAERPLQISNHHGKVLFESKQWIPSIATLPIEYDLSATDGQIALRLSLLENMEFFYGRVNTTQLIIIATMTSFMVLGVLAVMWMFNHLIFRPLNLLRQGMMRCSNGNFSESVRGVDREDEIGRVVVDFNGTMSALCIAIGGVNEVMSSLSKGVFDHRVSGDLAGELQTLQQSVNGTAELIGKTIGALQDSMLALSQADFHYTNNMQLTGGYREILDSTQTTMAALAAAMGEIGRVMTAVAEGNYQERITLSLPGELAHLKTNINQSVTAQAEAMTSAKDATIALANKDLTQRMDCDCAGELAVFKESINDSIGALQNMVREIRDTAGDIGTAASEIACGNNDLSKRTESQAAALEETASAMEQMTAAVKSNSGSAKQVSEFVKETMQYAEQGGAVVTRAVTSMNDISESSQQIVTIIGLIDEIAFQTNLLALNAAVEAARAGEQGRGFAVVAGEVRNLASRSANAAKEIKGLIKDAVEKVNEGKGLVGDTGQQLEQIIVAVKKVNELIQEIVNAGEEQSIGIEEVNKSISHMDEMTQQNAALVEQAAAASSSLEEQTQVLVEIMADFEI